MYRNYAINVLWNATGGRFLNISNNIEVETIIFLSVHPTFNFNRSMHVCYLIICFQIVFLWRRRASAFLVRRRFDRWLDASSDSRIRYITLNVT